MQVQTHCLVQLSIAFAGQPLDKAIWAQPAPYFVAGLTTVSVNRRQISNGEGVAQLMCLAPTHKEKALKFLPLSDTWPHDGKRR